MLIVDDDDDSRLSLREVLELALPEVQVRAAADAGEALRVLAREPVRVVISDYKMPGEDGLAFLLRARRAAPGAARLLVTALPLASLPTGPLREAELAHVVTKPFDARAFVRLVQGCLGPDAVPATP